MIHEWYMNDTWMIHEWYMQYILSGKNPKTKTHRHSISISSLCNSSVQKVGIHHDHHELDSDPAQGAASSIRWSSRYGRTNATKRPADLKPLAVKSGYCKLKRTAPKAMVIKAILEENVWFKTFSTLDGITKGSIKSANSGHKFKKTVPQSMITDFWVIHLEPLVIWVCIIFVTVWWRLTHLASPVPGTTSCAYIIIYPYIMNTFNMFSLSLSLCLFVILPFFLSLSLSLSLSVFSAGGARKSQRFSPTVSSTWRPHGWSADMPRTKELQVSSQRVTWSGSCRTKGTLSFHGSMHLMMSFGSLSHQQQVAAHFCYLHKPAVKIQCKFTWHFGRTSFATAWLGARWLDVKAAQPGHEHVDMAADGP